MTKLVMCIACLATDVKMLPIINPIHKEFFMKLVDFKPTVDDATHDMLCYFCFSQLQRCYRFICMSRKAQGILQQLRCHGTQLSQCTVSALKGKPTNSFVFSVIKTYDKVFVEGTMENVNSAQDIKPLIITPMHTVKEEYLEITDVAEEESVTVKQEPIDNVEYSLENQQPHKIENKVLDSKVTHLIKQLKSTIQAHLDNNKTVNGMHTVKPSAKGNDNSLLKPLKRKYIRRKEKVLKIYTCNDCDKTFTCRGYLERHFRVHTGEKPFNCENCDKKFAQQSHLKQHMRQHTGERPYSCHICKNKSFSHQYNYKTHMRKHFGEKTHKCELCIAKFHQKGDLQRHILSHTGEKPFSCNFCQTKFSQKCHMTKHIKDFHSGDKANDGASTTLVQTQEMLPKGTKRFTCSYTECLKVFLRKGALDNHISRIHLGVHPENSLVCNKCQKTFKQRLRFIKHTCQLNSQYQNPLKNEVRYEHDKKKNDVRFEHQDVQMNEVRFEHQDLQKNEVRFEHQDIQKNYVRFKHQDLQKNEVRFKHQDLQKNEMRFEHQDVQINKVKCEYLDLQKNEDHLQQNLNNVNENKIYFQPHDDEEYIIP